MASASTPCGLSPVSNCDQLAVSSDDLKTPVDPVPTYTSLIPPTGLVSNTIACTFRSLRAPPALPLNGEKFAPPSVDFHTPGKPIPPQPGQLPKPTKTWSDCGSTASARIWPVLGKPAEPGFDHVSPLLLEIRIWVPLASH